MRLNEITTHKLPPSHPVLAVLQIDADQWHRFHELADNAQGVKIVGHCPAPAGRLTVFVGCSTDGIRQKLEEAWG